MAYCHDCGEEVLADARFCNECGAELGEETTDAPIEDEEVNVEDTDSSGFSVSLAVTAAIMGLFIGFFAWWGTSQMAGSLGWVVFLGVWLLAGLYLYRKPIPSSAVGSGLYAMALLIALTPILFYIPVIFTGSEPETAAGAGAFIGGILGLVIWGFVGLVVGLVVFALGYFVNRRASKKLSAA